MTALLQVPLQLGPDRQDSGLPIPTSAITHALSTMTNAIMTPRAIPATESNANDTPVRSLALTPTSQILHVARDGVMYVNLSTLSFVPSALSPQYPDFNLTFNDLVSGNEPTFFVRLGQPIGQGALWTVFDADLLALNVDPGAPHARELSARVMHRVVVKVTRSGTTLDDFAWCESAAQAEAKLFAGPLLKGGLVGTVVPTFYGMWSARLPRLGDHVLIAVYERVGDPIEGPLIPHWTSHIQRLYERIHGAGVIHGDIQLRHIRRRQEGLCLIDFDHAYEDPGGFRGRSWQAAQERLKLDQNLAKWIDGIDDRDD